MSACGGGGGEVTKTGDTIPPAATFSSFPANSVSSASEVGVGSFEAIYAQSIKDFSRSRAPGVGELSTGKVTIFSTTAGEMVVQLDSGVRYVFEERSQTTRSDGNIDYTYAEKDNPGSTTSLLIRRGQNGGRYGYFLIDPIGSISPTRATFHYGWKTPASGLPSTGSATYSFPGGGQLYTTDGRRLFGHPTNLNVDFANDRVSGELFNNLGSPDFDLQARISINNAPLDAEGAFNANSISATFVDTKDPITTTGAVTGGAEGQLYGPVANSISGNFEGSVDISQPTAGTSTFGFNGVFSGLKQ